MIFINPTVELYLHIIKIICIKIEQQQEGNQMVHSLVYFEMFYYVDFNLHKQSNK